MDILPNRQRQEGDGRFVRSGRIFGEDLHGQILEDRVVVEVGLSQEKISTGHLL